MNRDMDKIRGLLAEVESRDASKLPVSVGDQDTAYQVALMKEAGFIDAQIVEDGRGIPDQAIIYRLTWVGHDFLDASRDNRFLDVCNG